MLSEQLFQNINTQQSVARWIALFYQMPSGMCAGCTTCCHDSVPVSLVEYATLRPTLRETPERFEQAVLRAKQFVVNELTTVNACPLLEDKRCTVYQTRPLTCRLFGFQSRAEQKRREKHLVEAHRQIARDVLETTGFTVPDAVIRHVIPYCEAFIPDRGLSPAKQRSYYDALMALNAPIFIEKVAPESLMGLTLVEWILLDADALDSAYAEKDVLLQSLGQTGIKKTK